MVISLGDTTSPCTYGIHAYYSLKTYSVIRRYARAFPPTRDNVILRFSFAKVHKLNEITKHFRLNNVNWLNFSDLN